jgi:hypothetical protein
MRRSPRQWRRALPRLNERGNALAQSGWEPSRSARGLDNLASFMARQKRIWWQSRAARLREAESDGRYDYWQTKPWS